MKFVTYNIQYGKGQDGRTDLKRIVDAVAGADVIALQEVERHFPRSGDVDQVAVIAALLPDYFWVYGAGVDLHAAGADAHRRRQFGNMLLSRTPCLTAHNHLLPKSGSIGAPSIQRSALEATIVCGADKLRVYSVHLTHLSGATRLPQVAALLDIHANAARAGAPVSGDLAASDWAHGVPELLGDGQTVAAHAVLLGDFNFQPDAAEYDLLVGHAGDYGGRVTDPQGFVDAWCVVGDGDGADDRHSNSDSNSDGVADRHGATSDVNGKPARLDYAFVSAALRDDITDCRVDTTASGSDHFPLWVEIDC